MKNFIIAIAIIACVYGGYQHFTTQSALDSELRAAEATVADGGFVSLSPIQMVNNPGIVIVAALDCPSEETVKADQLAAELQKRSIPFTRTSHTGWSDQTPSFSTREEAEAYATERNKQLEPAMKRLRAVMNQPSPLVFINYKVKSNPSLEEVLAEYHRCQVCP
jgi:hypothetical protein